MIFSNRLFTIFLDEYRDMSNRLVLILSSFDWCFLNKCKDSSYISHVVSSVAALFLFYFFHSYLIKNLRENSSWMKMNLSGGLVLLDMSKP